ncbi:class I SAM-dependent methyltransferase, partial [Bacillus velezensis]
MINMLSRRFSRPKGVIGMIAGYIMAAENQTLNQWTINQLGITRG